MRPTALLRIVPPRLAALFFVFLLSTAAGAHAPPTATGAGAAGPGEASSAPPITSAKAPSTTTGTPGVVATSSPTAPGDDGRRSRIAGIVTGAAGVALVAVGMAYGAAANSAA